jgi:hypothetical protein
MAGLMPAKATNRIVDDSWVDVERPVVAGYCLMQTAWTARIAVGHDRQHSTVSRRSDC